MNFFPSRTKAQRLQAGIRPQAPYVANQTCGCCGTAKSLAEFERKDGGKRLSRICCSFKAAFKRAAVAG